MNALGIIIGLAMVAAILGCLGYLFWLALKMMKDNEKGNGKCPDCGQAVKKTNLFCPWCHRDLRGGGKN